MSLKSEAIKMLCGFLQHQSILDPIRMLQVEGSECKHLTQSVIYFFIFMHKCAFILVVLYFTCGCIHGIVNNFLEVL